jgi:hypothetical protein
LDTQKSEAPECNPNRHGNFEEDDSDFAHQCHKRNEQDEQKCWSAESSDLEVAGIAASAVDAGHFGGSCFGNRGVYGRGAKAALAGRGIDGLLAAGTFKDLWFIEIGRNAKAVGHGSIHSRDADDVYVGWWREYYKLNTGLNRDVLA